MIQKAGKQKVLCCFYQEKTSLKAEKENSYIFLWFSTFKADFFSHFVTSQRADLQNCMC